MSASLVIGLIGAWIGLNVVVFAVLVRRSTRRRERRPRVLGRPASTAPVEGYASVLLLRVLIQICRVAGAHEGCVLLRDPSQPDVLVPVATHGLDEGAVGRRIETIDGGWQLNLVDADGRAIDAAGGSTIPLVRATIGECGYLWLATRPAEALGDGPPVGELATLLERALDDLDHPADLEASISRALAMVCAEDDPRAGADYAGLCRAVGKRLGLDASALIELDLAARVQHAVSQHPTAAVRLLPGFEAVAIVLRFAAERWDGAGPHRLRGEGIPLDSRILAVCHALEPPPEAALRAIQGDSGRAYDPAVVTALSVELLGPIPELGAPAEHWADGDRLFDAPVL